MKLRALPALACLLTLASAPACTTDEPQAEGTSDAQEEGEEESGETADSTEGDGDGDEEGPPPDPEVMWLLEEIVFYDGYAGLVDEPVPEGVIRHSNALNAIKFSDEQLDKLQDTLKIGVVNGALCDNYDRIGAVNLALVPKGSDTYVPGEVDRIEVARFITPFMDMNDEPSDCPYEWEASNLIPLFKDPELRETYDFWWELYIFGVPYAANNEIEGCAGRNDTQLGSLLLYTDSAEEPQDFNTMIPLAINEGFNNYAEGASDMVGTTRKTVEFELPADSEEVQLVLITSNHGANEGGEEYNRRDHYIYVDGDLVHEYKPGRTTCEPFRKYNTQSNGIYGFYPRTDEEWQSFSNWCPGDIIDTRIIGLGAMTAGTHEFVIDVPDAVFADGQGNIPFSLYVQAR